MNIGKTIKVLRTAAGISQKNFAQKLGISSSYLSLIESGEREPSVALLRQISRLLDIPISVFFFQAEDPSVLSTPAQQEEHQRVQELMGQVLQQMLTKRANLQPHGAED